MLKQGIAPSQEIRAWAENGTILSRDPVKEEQIQPGSMDLRIADTLYKIKGIFRPTHAMSVHLSDPRIVEEVIPIPSDGVVLEKGATYLIPLQESLKLDPHAHATLNPKSSTGRIDLSTKVMGENFPVFDSIQAGY